MRDEDKERLVQIVERLDVQIQRLAIQMYGTNAIEDSPAYNLSLLLPDLLENALAGDVLPEGEVGGTTPGGTTPGDPDLAGALGFGPGEDSVDPAIRSAIDDATREIEDPKVELENLEVREVPAPLRDDVGTLPPFEEFVKDKRVHPDAIAWAKGSPSKEAALVETLLGLHEGLWGITQVPKMCERTYEARTARADTP